MSPEKLEKQSLTRADEPLFERVLGADWERLHPLIRATHSIGAERVLQGSATVRRGDTWLGRLAATVCRLPAAGEDVPVTVTMIRGKRDERWIRDFGGKRFATTLSDSRGALCERFGLLGFDIALCVRDESLHFPIGNVRLLGMRLPAFLQPVSNSREYVEDGRFHFDVELSLPISRKRIVRYCGWLVAGGS